VPYARISITLPSDLVKAADRRASELDRSRSWLIAQALSGYLENPADGAPPRSVSEPSPAATYAAREVEAARTARLARELRLTPEERLRLAEDIARPARLLRRRGRRHQIIGFDTYEDFYEWKKAHRAGG
jgi:hypothetical protein